ncbi:MAG: tRNA 2-thiouridine(34) synthase MnmA [Bdellovibrionota bacterium]
MSTMPTTTKLVTSTLSAEDNKTKSTKGKVLVAMSGGVDSSVAAAILVEQGYEVVGITMQVWDYTQCDIEEGFGTCCSSMDVDDARQVAEKLNFPFYVMNCEAKFKAQVIDPFVEAYLEGKTPLPCVNCNTYLKFDHLIQKMNELGCDYLATGHYAKIVVDANGQSQIVVSDDDWKDQTYFLFTLQQDIIPKILFPIGHMKKADVRALGERQGLLNARKKDSTGICFVGDGKYSEFVEGQISKDLIQSGFMKKYPTGEIVGKHGGIHKFTYGQRKGLGLDFQEAEPMFVLKLDPKTSTVWVGEEKYLFYDKAHIINTNWFDDIQETEELNVKIRYQHKGAQAKIRKNDDGSAEIYFDIPVRAITPGQAAVVYRGNQLLGGGWITTVPLDTAAIGVTAAIM